MARVTEENRVKQIAVGVGILAVLTLVVCSALIAWPYLPGLLGEWIGMIIGVMTTPFFLEASFIIIGIILVIALNHWRQHRDGDELVYLDQIEGPDVPDELPEHAKWAIYHTKPLDGEMPGLIEQIEGALAIGDFESAVECIAALSDAELKLPKILSLRIELAKATGKKELVRALEDELRNSSRIS